MRGVWQNKELTSKDEDVQLITRWKHVPDQSLLEEKAMNVKLGNSAGMLRPNTCNLMEK